MRNYKTLATVAAILPLYLGCAHQHARNTEEHIDTKHGAKSGEVEVPFVYERPRDKHLRATLFGKLGEGIQGCLFLYDDGKRELDITSKSGRLHAIDFNNDGGYDTVEGTGDLQRYSNNSFLNWVAEEILAQNR